MEKLFLLYLNPMNINLYYDLRLYLFLTTNLIF